MNEAGNRIHGTTREVPLNRYAEVEKGLLKALPDAPPEPAVWAKVKVHGDTHVQFDWNYYSAPFRLVGQDLWLKATDKMVTLYQQHEPVASHVRATGKGHRRSVADHLPPEAKAWQMQSTKWCLRHAKEIGPSCYAAIHTMFADRVLIRMRAVQGVLRLKQKYGATRLEAACSRANHYGTPTYQVIRTILEKGLDQQELIKGFDALAATYTEGGRFCRNSQTIQ